MSVRFIIGMQEWFFNLSCEKVAASFSNELVKRLAPLRSFYRWVWVLDNPFPLLKNRKLFVLSKTKEIKFYFVGFGESLQ